MTKYGRLFYLFETCRPQVVSAIQFFTTSKKGTYMKEYARE